MKKFLLKLDDWLEKGSNVIMIVTGVTVCLLIFISAMTRYIFKVDFYGSEELILFTAFWLYFTGSSVAAKKTTHINANMLSMFCKNEKIINVFQFIKCTIGLLICLVATYWSFKYVAWSASMGALSNVFKLPNIIGQIPIFISFLIWTLYLIRDVVLSIQKLRGKPEGGEKSC